MKRWHDNTGFSLAETLIALGILAVGMLLIAGAFPVAIRLTTLNAERTIATVVAEEAFAKVRLYVAQNTSGMKQLQIHGLSDFNDPLIFPAVANMGKYEFTYPSDGFSTGQKQYCWSALCRTTADANSPVQVTVFVCRKPGPSLKFPHQPTAYQPSNLSDWPVPYRLSVKPVAANKSKIKLDPTEVSAKRQTYITDASIIVDNDLGQIYRAVGRLPAPDDDQIQLDRDWQGSGEIWVIPPAVSGIGQSASGRNPCIAVYQELIQF